MRRVAVVLNVLTPRRVGQSVLVLLADLAHDGAQGFLFLGVGGRGGERAEDGAGDERGRRGCRERNQVGRGVERDGWVRVPAQHALDGCRAVEAACHAAAEGLDAGDCFGRGARHDDVDWGGESLRILRLVRTQSVLRYCMILGDAP